MGGVIAFAKLRSHVLLYVFALEFCSLVTCRCKERLSHAEEPNERKLHGYTLADWTGAALLDSSNQVPRLIPKLFIFANKPRDLHFRQAADVNAPPDILSVLRRETLQSWVRHRGMTLCLYLAQRRLFHGLGLASHHSPQSTAPLPTPRNRIFVCGLLGR